MPKKLYTLYYTDIDSLPVSFRYAQHVRFTDVGTYVIIAIVKNTKQRENNVILLLPYTRYALFTVNTCIRPPLYYVHRTCPAAEQNAVNV